MLLLPRSTHRTRPCSGLSSQGTLLALAGVGAVLFLFLLLPRLTATRAAEQRTHALPAAAAIEAERGGDVGSAPVDAELVIVPAAGLAAGDAGPAAPALSVDGAAAATADGTALAAVAEEDEGPKLKYAKSTGPAEKVEPGAGRAEQREQRKQRAKAAAENGEVVPPPAGRDKQKAAANPNRSRIESRAGKGRAGSRKEEKPKEKPKDG